MKPPLFPLANERTMTRRAFVTGTASFALAALMAPHLRGALEKNTRFPSYPFTLGIASGDPAPDGFVLWTRLAPTPLLPGGGMSAEPVAVQWQVCSDEAMTRVVRAGTAIADAAWGHSVHVEVAGLEPARWYWYQFKAGSEVSAKGRSRTMPASGVEADKLRFAFASCQKYESGYYTAFEHLAREELDLVVHLGDYIYEKGPDEKAVRQHNGPEIFTLDDYRARYALYKTDPALQAAHAVAPWIVTWDDHEVSNNYAGDCPEFPDKTTRADFLLRRAAGYQAYYEHMPLRRSALPRGPEMLLYRRLEFGSLASFHVLDTRQYRSDQPQGDGVKTPGPGAMDPAGTMLGQRQREWLNANLEKSSAQWNVLAQQVMMGFLDSEPGPEVKTSMDKWGGYEFERRRVLRELRDQRIKNPVVITGDIHSNWANELVTDFDDAKAAPVGVEFVGTSISSGGDGGDHGKYSSDKMRAENPNVKYFNNERGYVYCEVTPKTWRADYRTVEYVSRRGALRLTRASFLVESGHSRLQRI
ncbi:alkaline phosphatase D family protein [Oleiharenicola lentus]|uniref:alkaline phosphatase D family protein n=1 Tax=Oleiharenicola lentus TaxID=2508720 RepID=UPI003F6760A0